MNQGSKHHGSSRGRTGSKITSMDGDKVKMNEGAARSLAKSHCIANKAAVSATTGSNPNHVGGKHASQ